MNELWAVSEPLVLMVFSFPAPTPERSSHAVLLLPARTPAAVPNALFAAVPPTKLSSPAVWQVLESLGCLIGAAPIKLKAARLKTTAEVRRANKIDPSS
jgi:hypothetical protein